MRKERIGLIGYGHYGRFVASHLSGKFRVAAYDPAAGRNNLRAALAAGTVLLAIPVAAYPSFLRRAEPLLRPDTLIVDLASVKLRPLSLLSRRFSNPTIGVHTLFGPESARDRIRGLPAIVAGGSADAVRRRCVVRFLGRQLGLSVTEMSAAEHDRQMAWVQGLPHLVSMAFGSMSAPALKHATRSFDTFREMHRILRRTTWPLFETIGAENPYAANVRTRFLAALRRLDGRLSSAGKRKGDS